MINAGNLIGALMKDGLNNVGAERLQNAFGAEGMAKSGLGDILDSVLGGGQQGGADLGSMLGNALGGNKSGAAGGINDILGSVLGGGKAEGAGAAALGGVIGSIFGEGQSIGGAAKGGAMAVLGMLAFNALKKYLGDKMSDPQQASSMQLMAGLREPDNDDEKQAVEDFEQLILKAMINAAKADGQIDASEMEKIVGRLQQDGADDGDLQFIREQLSSPMDTDGIVNAVNNMQAAAQIYAASLLAIKLDTPAEQQYINELAERMGLPQGARDEMHGMLAV